MTHFSAFAASKSYNTLKSKEGNNNLPERYSFSPYVPNVLIFYFNLNFWYVNTLHREIHFILNWKFFSLSQEISISHFSICSCDHNFFCTHHHPKRSLMNHFKSLPFLPSIVLTSHLHFDSIPCLDKICSFRKTFAYFFPSAPSFRFFLNVFTFVTILKGFFQQLILAKN